MIYLLDTHVWIWWHADPAKISQPACEAIEGVGEEDRLLLSPISIWEVSRLVQKGRLALSMDLEVWVGRALDFPRLSIAELTPEVAIESNRLPGEFHRDPADQIIVATARITGATVITTDKAIRSYSHVRTLW